MPPTSTYIVIDATPDQIHYLKDHWPYEKIDAKTYDFIIPDDEVDNFVDWCENHDIEYQLLGAQ